ncbi:MAG: hypothetical protein WA077_06970, partial [Anaerolineae bacterium]
SGWPMPTSEKTSGRKTTNRLRAIETLPLLEGSDDLHALVARPLIAFGRLKLTTCSRSIFTPSGRKTTNRLRESVAELRSSGG